MTEQEAREALGVSRETLEHLEVFAALLREESGRQNLVSAASLDHLWARHVLDSAQLLRLVPRGVARWLDLGSGAGFPGMVLAMLASGSFTLVEARRLRAEFLVQVAEAVGIQDKVQVLCSKAEAVEARPFDVITARAFAPLEKLLTLGSRFATPETIWILPKGRSAKTELEAARRSWQGDFRLENSVTDADARILVATDVHRRAKGKNGR